MKAQLSVTDQTALTMSAWQRKVRQIIASTTPSRKTALVGMGHPLRTDDNLGSYIIKRIIAHSRSERSDSILLFDGEDNVESLITKIAELEPRNIVFIDACEMRESPGATKLIPVVETTFPFFTTHGVPLKLLAEQILAKSDVSILAIQPKNTDFGEELSEEIRGVADSVSDFITNLLKERRQ